MEAHDIAIFDQRDSVRVSLHLKFPADLDLREAASVAERVELAIRAHGEVSAVQIHLEPLERPLTARPPDEDADRAARGEIERLVHERTGTRPRHLTLLSTDAGRVIFLTLGVRPGESLTAAHELAGELEDELRHHVPDIADVVIRTDP
jgi:divalent metal cation (Fe/Co/Zn/Cd) transporter